ncbi:PREDICTED: uncharacterized protein LOC106745985 [Dinoponera quadriceps]|uniref:Uncharacterized protein LOC106745985 n=1 Tax=Dinoponera quadriceps TaxID=609295 RepID=A0A6P3XGK4_DINQU|nr:PREDICTED: uncharacterized protein LOC106745985 [Dinoponera quadriceps]
MATVHVRVNLLVNDIEEMFIGLRVELFYMKNSLVIVKKRDSPGAGRAGNRAAKKRTAEPTPRRGVRSRVKPTGRKPPSTPYRRRQPYDSISIPQLVYELLTIDKYNRDIRRSPRFETPPRRTRQYREQQRFPHGMVGHHNNSESIRMPEYMTESRPTSVESLTEVTDAGNSSAPASSANSSVSNVSMKPITLANSLNSARVLLKKKSLVQIINNYIKAGIEEGKRQAKKYIRKALSFGVRSGYLIPADAQGHLLHVCPTLASSSRKTSDPESRRKRRIARHGETRVTTTDDRRAMRRGVPRSKTSRREDTTTSGRRRYKRHPTESPASSLSAKNDGPRTSPARSRLREKNKSGSSGAPRNRPCLFSKINARASNKRERKRGDSEGVEKPVKRRRTALSPRRAGNNHVPVVESYENAKDRDRDRYKSNGDNHRATTERRKPTSSRENESRIEGQKAGLNIDDDRDDVGRKMDGDDDKSEEASVERDANGTNGETVA